VRLRATPAELALLLTMSSFGLAASALVLYEFYTLHRLPRSASTTLTPAGFSSTATPSSRARTRG